MTLTAADIVAAARMAVHRRHPYLSHVLFALRPHPAPGLGTMAVDEGWRLYYDPVTVLRWHDESWQAKMNALEDPHQVAHDGVAGVVFHEISHVLRRHFERRGGRDPKLWNRACDREINDDVLEAKWKLPGQPLLPEHIGMANGLCAEQYYLVTQCDEGHAAVPGCGGSCGGAVGNPTAWEQENSGAGVGPRGLDTPGEAGDPSLHEAGSPSFLPDPASELEQQIVLRRTALDTLDHLKTRCRGLVPAGLQAWAKAALTPPKIDWRRRLAGLCRRALATTAGACDFTWRRTGRRTLHSAGRAGWPIAPALHQPIPKVAVVLDTSGSMGCSHGERSRLDAALSEVLGLVQAAGGNLWGVACDAQAQAITPVSNQRDLTRLNKGGGGTDMRPGFQAAMKLRPDVVIILTDGQVGDGWPSQEDCHRVRVLAGVVGDAKQVPVYIPSVEIDA